MGTSPWTVMKPENISHASEDQEFLKHQFSRQEKIKVSLKALGLVPETVLKIN